MPTISLSDASYAKLQSVAKPFIDTEESAFGRVIDFYLEHNGTRPEHPRAFTNGNGRAETRDDSMRLSPESGKLTHTKILSATVDGTTAVRAKWNSLMFLMHVMARKRLGSYEAVRKVSQANLRSGRYEDDGYHYLAEADLSVQGVDANLACQHAFRLAKVLKVSLKVTFQWRDKEDAAYPGQTGIIEWDPNND
jgi:hypothetical protein